MAEANGTLTHDLTVLGPESVRDFDFLGTNAQVFEHRCFKAGSSGFDAFFDITEMGDTNPVVVGTGLPGTPLTFQLVGEVTCEG